MRLSPWLRDTVRSLPPGSFAFVMATGIVSIAADLAGAPLVPDLLFALNLFAYAALLVLTLWRLVLWPELARDLTSHARGPGFLTLVVATSTLGSQAVVLGRARATGMALWLAALLLWLALVYTFFAGVIVALPKPDLSAGLDGSWLLAVVATESVSVLAALLAARPSGSDARLLFLALVLCLIGAALYVLLMTWIFYRLVFVVLQPLDMTPAYWINMGATAITSLAGASILADTGNASLVAEVRPFLAGLTLLFWATGAWWIPLLVILETWRHVRRIPARYETERWAMVFPLGMFSASTFELSRALLVPLLLPVARAAFVFASAAWVIVLAGMIVSFWRTLTSHGHRGTAR